MLITYHQTVLLNEAVDALNVKPSGIYIDGTFGLGGHSKLILSKLSKYGRLIAMDRDLESVKIGAVVFKQDKRFVIIHTPFSKMFKCIQDMKLVGLIDGILLDLGICELQLANAARGFSFMKDGPLDMRMDITTGQSVAAWLKRASQRNIEWVLKNFGEERFAKKIAKAIVLKRYTHPIIRSLELSKLISNVILYHSKYYRYKHPATRSFLAFRIHINEELKEIMQVLQDSLMLLSPRGRLVVISFNSLEDRLVKHFIYQNSYFLSTLPKLALTENQIYNMYHRKYKFKNMGKLMPSVCEIKKNLRARSAILRCAEKIIV